MKKLAAAFAAVLLLLPLAACTGQNAARPLTVGALPSIDVLPFVIAGKQGYFKKYGVEFKLELFKSSKDRDASFQANALDGLCCDEVAVCIYQDGGTDLVITGMTEGEYVLVAGKDTGIKSIADMKGHTVAISENTLIEYTLFKILEKNGMKVQDVETMAVPPLAVRLEAVNSGLSDMALLPEPFATFAENEGGVRLQSATGIGLYPSVIAFPRQMIDGRRADIAAMYKAYNDAVDYLNSTPVSEYEDLVIETVGYPEEMRGKIKLPVFTKDAMPGEGDLPAVIEWAAAKGLCKPDLDADKLVELVR